MLADDIAAYATQSVITYNPDGTVRSWNAASAILYGWPDSATVGARLDQHAPAGWLPWHEVSATDDWHGIVQRRRMDGALIEVGVRLITRRSPEGAIVDLVEFGPIPSTAGSLVDGVDDAQRQDRFKGLLEHMPIALWQVDATSAGQVFEALRAQGVTDIAAYLVDHPELVEFACDTVMVSKVNRAAVHLLNGEGEAQFLKPVRYIFEATPQAAVRVMTAHYAGARNHVEELKVKTFDGRILDVLFLVTYPRPPEDLTTTFITMIDISDQLRAESELRQLQADFVHAARISTLGEMVASIAHEVKQPLAAIVTNGGAGLRWLAGGSVDRAAARIERIISSAEQANEIIQRIQGMAAKREPVWSDLDMNEVLDEALQFVGHESLEKQIRIVTELDRTIPFVRGDRVQLQQVLVNLLVNSFHAIEANQSRERIVWVRTSCENDWVEVAVSDTGLGIPIDNLDRIFNGFFTTKDSGMGIGLTICQSIVASHGGSIEAANLSAGGAIVRFRLPRSGIAARTRASVPKLSNARPVRMRELLASAGDAA